ncbi:unnamed protein product, partial [Oppiella nova]
TDEGQEADLQLKETAKKTLKSMPSIESLKFSVKYMTENIVRFTIRDAKNARYEVPVQQVLDLMDKVEKDKTKRRYSVDVSTDSKDFKFSITRKDTKTKVFDTSISGLVFADQFLQLATNLATKNVYGFGTNHSGTDNLYGVHPFYIVLETDGKAHGILFFNSNAMEYTLLPDPALSLKTLGGVLDFFVFLCDNPEHVIQLYTSVIGRQTMPPFWGLGYQLCRYGYTGTKNLREDTMYIDIDYMDRYEDFTYDKSAFAGLPELFKDTKTKNQLHWTLILDPGIEGNNKQYQTFSEGYKNDVFVKWPKSVDPKDRFNPPDAPTNKDTVYGKGQIKNLHDILPFDSLWIDMNEPSNFNARCPNNKYDFPPIRSVNIIGNQLSASTLCMVAIQGEKGEYKHYDVHSLYGLVDL